MTCIASPNSNNPISIGPLEDTHLLFSPGGKGLVLESYVLSLLK